MTEPAPIDSPGTPRWVKIAGLVAVVVLLVIGVILLTGGPGEHGPGRHSGSDGAKRHAPPGTAPEARTRPPGVPQDHTGPPPGAPEHRSP